MREFYDLQGRCRSLAHFSIHSSTSRHRCFHPAISSSRSLASCRSQICPHNDARLATFEHPRRPAMKRATSPCKFYRRPKCTLHSPPSCCLQSHHYSSFRQPRRGILHRGACLNSSFRCKWFRPRGKRMCPNHELCRSCTHLRVRVRLNGPFCLSHCVCC